MIFSGGMIPEYLVMRRLGLVNNWWILVVKHGMNVYNLVLMRNFFEGIPGSLYEAAKIDGCTFFQIYRLVILPLLKPVMATIALLSFRQGWNEYILPLVFTMSK